MADDPLVLAANVVENEVDDAGNVTTKVVAERGDPMPASLKDERDLYITEGLLVTKEYLKLKDDPQLAAALASGDPEALAFSTRQELAHMARTSNEAAGEPAIQAKPPTDPDAVDDALDDVEDMVKEGHEEAVKAESPMVKPAGQTVAKQQAEEKEKQRAASSKKAT